MRYPTSFVLILAVGCADTSKADVDVDAGVTQHDAAPAIDPRPSEGASEGASVGTMVAWSADTTVPCAIANPLPAFTQTPDAIAEEDTAAAKFVVFDDLLNADPKPDIVDIELYDGWGAFATTPLGIGTFTLTADDASYATCGACLVFDGDVDLTAKTRAGIWLASAGTLTITSLQPHLKGSISNVSLRQVDVAPMTLATTDNASGCTSAVSSLAFDIAVTPDDQVSMVNAGTAPGLARAFTSRADQKRTPSASPLPDGRSSR